MWRACANRFTIRGRLFLPGMKSIQIVIGRLRLEGLKVKTLRNPWSAALEEITTVLYGPKVGVSPKMSQFVRKPVRSIPTDGTTVLAIDVANEKHYSVSEVAQLWGLSERTIRRMFENEPSVLCWGSPEARHRRGYRTLRIPETVMLRVHRQLQIAG